MIMQRRASSCLAEGCWLFCKASGSQQHPLRVDRKLCHTLIADLPAACIWLFSCRYSKEDVQHLVGGMLIHMDDAEETIRNAVCEVHPVGDRLKTPCIVTAYP